MSRSSADLNDDDNTPETARTLTPGTTAAGRVHRDEDVDWYSIAVPQGQNSISIDVGGVPTVGVSLTLFDDAGPGSADDLRRRGQRRRPVPGERHRGRDLSRARAAATVLGRVRVRHQRQHGRLPALRLPGAAGLHRRRGQGRRGGQGPAVRGGPPAARLERRRVPAPGRGRPVLSSAVARAAPRRRSSMPPSSSPDGRVPAPCCW